MTRGRADRGTAPAFRPRRGRVVPLVIGVLVLVGSIALAISLPADRFGLPDRAVCIGMGLGISAFMSRYVTIHAEPRQEGLWVRNLGPGELVPWEDIEAVRFSQGMPWPRVDLADGDDMAVMAIQRADGPRGAEEAQRLADIVALRGRRTG